MEQVEERWASVDQPLQLRVECNSTFMISEPRSIKQALSGPHAAEWRASLRDEFNSHHKLGTMKLVDYPAPGKRLLHGLTVFKIKRDKEGKLLKFKSRLVAVGSGQKPGDYVRTDAPCINLNVLRVVLSSAAQLDWEIRHLDVKTAHLYGDLEEELYLRIPNGYADVMDLDAAALSGKAFRLEKSIYGLKQAGYNWYMLCSTTFIEKLGFRKSRRDDCLYIKDNKDGTKVIVCVQVDDMMITGDWNDAIFGLCRELNDFFETIDQGDLEFYMSIRFTRDREKGFLYCDQENYIREQLELFNMAGLQQSKTPQVTGKRLPPMEEDAADFECPYGEAVGGLMYAMVGTRPDIAAAVGDVCKHTKHHGEQHWEAVLRIFKYLNGTRSHCIRFGSDKSMKLSAYVDADFAMDLDKRKSTTGYEIMFGGGPVAWQSKLQGCVARSTAEAEFVALSTLAGEITVLRDVLADIGYAQNRPTPILEDNTTVVLTMQGGRMRNLIRNADISCAYARLAQENKEITVSHVNTDDNIADMMTKGLPVHKFERFRDNISVVEAYRP
jgi:hypothetical protein